MTLIKQRGKVDCGVAVAAMVGDVTSSPLERTAAISSAAEALKVSEKRIVSDNF